MGITSLQVCMDSSDWLQGTIHEECAAGVGGMDSSSSPSGGDHINNLMTCSRPIIVDQRRLRPPHDHSIKCPRCDSTHTKFCYYNNYSLTQPRYFCKTCRRYWTKGGTLRNIPVGGGCRKNKKVSSKKSSNNNTNEPLPTPNNNSIPEMPFPLHNHHHFMSGTNFGHHGNFILENQAPVIDFMESKYEALVGSTSNTHSRNQDLFLGNGDNNIGMMMISGASSSTTTGFGHGDNNIVVAPNYPFGMTSMDNGNNFGMLLPYENINHHHEEVQNINNNAVDVKPNPKILSLEWHDNDQLGVNKESSSFGYYSGSGGLGSWTGLMNGTNCYGSSATNPLV